MDIVLNLQSVTPDTLRLSIVKHRIQGSRPDIYMRKAGDDKFEVCGEVGIATEPGVGMYRVQERIIEFLDGETEPVHRKLIFEDVQDETGAKQRTIERGLEELMALGRVTKVKRGYYMLTELAPQAPTLGFGGNGGK